MSIKSFSSSFRLVVSRNESERGIDFVWFSPFQSLPSLLHLPSSILYRFFQILRWYGYMIGNFSSLQIKEHVLSDFNYHFERKV